MSEIRRLEPEETTAGELFVQIEDTSVPPLTPIDQVRLEIGDENLDSPLFGDAQIQYKLDGRGGNVLLAAADLCDVLATRYAGEYDFSSAARMTFRRSQKTAAYEARAKALRNRAGGLTTVSVTRVDGFSDDISTRDGSGQGSRTGRVRAGYFDPDLPV
jgi:hypothetical protein